MTPMMKFAELKKAEDAAMGESLKGSGFRRIAAGTWSRRRGDELNLIQLQPHSVEQSFCVNLGVHYTFLPKAGTEAPLDRDQIDIHDCEVKLRLTDASGTRDQWWPMSSSGVDAVAGVVMGRGMQLFHAYRLDGPIAAMDGKDIERGEPGLLGSLTKVRACLLLARLHEHAGNHDRCVETATIGLKLAGLAVGPKKALRDILKRS
jgi:hypothetical protein